MSRGRSHREKRRGRSQEDWNQRRKSSSRGNAVMRIKVTEYEGVWKVGEYWGIERSTRVLGRRSDGWKVKIEESVGRRIEVKRDSKEV